MLKTAEKLKLDKNKVKVRWVSGRATQKGWTKMGQNAIWGSGVQLKSTKDSDSLETLAGLHLKSQLSLVDASARMTTPR